MPLQKIGNLFFCSLLLLGPSGLTAQDPAKPAAPSGTSAVTVTITDRNHQPVPGLSAQDFALYEDSQLQPITSIRYDVPACVGLVVDSSGSMRHNLEPIDVALLDFIRSSNPESRFFVVNFNDRPYLDQDFTRDLELIDQGLRRAQARGGTALYDAVIASVTHLVQARACDRKVLLVVSDGEDNESRKSLQQTVAALMESPEVIVYAIGLARDNPTRSRQAQRGLETLVSGSGGDYFFLGNLKDMAKVAVRIAAEMRGQYLIGYGPAQRAGGALTKLTIEMRSASSKDLVIRMGRAQGPHAGQ